MAKTRKGLVLAGATACLILVVAYARYIDFPAFHHGLPESIEHRLKDIGLDTDHVRHYCVGKFIDSEWLVRLPLAEKDLNRVVGKLGLQPLDPTQVPSKFLRMAPYWWRPTVTEGTRAYSSSLGFPIEGRGPDGWYAMAIWNPQDELMYLWIKDNF